MLNARPTTNKVTSKRRKGNGTSARTSFDAPNRLYKDIICLDENTIYTFTLFDSHGDSLCCGWGDGYFSLVLDGTEIFSGGEGFGSEAEHTFGIPAGNCNLGESLFELSLLTDAFEKDTSWELVNDALGATVGSGVAYALPNTLYIEPLCIRPDETYVFTLYDSAGDSICCKYGDGSFSVALNGVEIFSGGGEGFGSQATHSFYVSPGPL